MPLDRRLAADAITASGRAQLRAEALTLPGVARGIDGAGQLAFSWRHGRLDGALSDLRGQTGVARPGMGHRRGSCCRRRGGSNSRSRPASRQVWPMTASSCRAAVGSRSRPQGHSWIPRSARPSPWTRTGGCASWSCATARSTCAISASPACGSIGARSGAGHRRARGLGRLARARARRCRRAVARTGARGRHRTGRSGRALGRWPPEP